MHTNDMERLSGIRDFKVITVHTRLCLFKFIRARECLRVKVRVSMEIEVQASMQLNLNSILEPVAVAYY